MKNISPELANYAQMVERLHETWQPHEGQIQAGRALFQNDIRSIFIQCGRKWGKTEFAVYILWRWAITNPGMGCYFIAPQLKQAKEIVWADPRIKNFGPREWLLPGSDGINNSDMRLKFRNGSFIKVDGSDNFESHRGTRPGILVYEESKDHRREFREVMRPNLSVYNAPEIFIGTPPEDVDESDIKNEYVLTAFEHIAGHGKKTFYKKATTFENPLIPVSWLADEKARLTLRGEEHIWQREYMANFVKGGASKIFPMLTREIMLPHIDLIKKIERDFKKLEWILWADPAAASCFGVLLCAINPYTKHIYVLDEIYEMEQSEMTVQKIGFRIIGKKNNIYSRGDWRQGYDEANPWFNNEMIAHYDESFEPTHKSFTAKEVGIGLLKDILIAGNITVSDRCVNWYWEMDNYRLDKNGKIPKKNDHLIDCTRYILSASGYNFHESEFYDPEKDPHRFRGAKIKDDFPDFFEEEPVYKEWEPT